MAQRISKIVLTDGGVWDSSKTYLPYTYVRHNGDGWWSTRTTTASEPAKGNADWVQATDTQEFILKLKETTTQAQAITDSATQAEQLRVEAEQVRAAAENERNADENLRKLSETERLAEESKRQNAEKSRVAAEAVRDGRYNEAEENRNTVFQAAESERQTAEEARKQAEAARIQAENERDAAEQLREALTVETKAAAADAKSATEAANTAAGKANEAADKFNAAIVQETGDAQDKVISQHGVTEAINSLTNKVTELESKVDLDKADSLFNEFGYDLVGGQRNGYSGPKLDNPNKGNNYYHYLLKVQKGEIVKIFTPIYKTLNAWYDVEGNRLSEFTLEAGETSLNVENDGYLCFSLAEGNNVDKISQCKLWKYGEIRKNIANIEDSIKGFDMQYEDSGYNIPKKCKNGYISTKVGVVNYDDNFRCIYIPIHSKNIYIFDNGTSTTKINNRWYDADGVSIGEEFILGIGKNYLVAPTGARYVGINLKWQNEPIEDIYLCKFYEYGDIIGKFADLEPINLYANSKLGYASNYIGKVSSAAGFRYIFIQVTSGNKYVINTGSSTFVNNAFYGNDGYRLNVASIEIDNALTATNGGEFSISGKHIIKAPAGSKWIVLHIQWENSDVDKYAYFYAMNYSNSALHSLYEKINVKDEILHNCGKNISFGRFGGESEVAVPNCEYRPYGIVDVIHKNDKVKDEYALYRNRIEIPCKGKISINLGANAYAANSPKIGKLTMLSPGNGSSISFDKDGYKRKDEYIHPSVAYSPTPICGYNYWMFASNYPGENPRYEDEDLLASSDGKSWYRILPPTSETDNSKPILPINAFDCEPDNGRENAFLPLPKNGFTTKINGTTKTFTKYLKHDPEILILNGEIFCYNFYNLYYNDTDAHRFIVVLSTTNGRDWYICRRDGSKIEATKNNLNEIFTQSSVDGKDNYIRYFTETIEQGEEAAAQIVNANGEWYMYYQPYQSYGNSSLGICRYSGSSHLDFNFDAEPIWTKLSGDTPYDGTVHKDVMYVGGKYYIIGETFVYESNDGITFNRLPYTPFIKSVGYGYKIDGCVGWRGQPLFIYGGLYTGKIAEENNSDGRGLPCVKSQIIEFESWDDFIGKCNNGRNDVSITAFISHRRITGDGYVKQVPITSTKTNNDIVYTQIVDTEVEQGDIVQILVIAIDYKGNNDTSIVLNKKLDIKFQAYVP